jgi:hypothetical protein
LPVHELLEWFGKRDVHTFHKPMMAEWHNMSRNDIKCQINLAPIINRHPYRDESPIR